MHNAQKNKLYLFNMPKITIKLKVVIDRYSINVYNAMYTTKNTSKNTIHINKRIKHQIRESNTFKRRKNCDLQSSSSGP